MEQRNEPTRWGSAAVARAGDFTIEVDEAVTGPPAWLVSIDGPAVSFNFQLSDISWLLSARSLFSDAGSKHAVEIINPPFQMKLEADDEPGGRRIIHLRGPAHHVRFVLAMDHVKHFEEALASVIAQMNLEGLWRSKVG